MKRTSPMLALSLPLVLALLVLAPPGHAHAQTPREPPPKSAKLQARDLFREGNKLFERGLYLDALDRYRKARKLYPSYKIDLNIGGTLDALGRQAEAATLFHRFLANSAQASGDVIAVAKSRLKELRRKLGSVRVSCQQAGAVVQVSGRIVGRTPLDMPIYLKPGRHRVMVTKPGFRPAEFQLNIRAGHHKRTLSVVLQSMRSGAARGASSIPPAAGQQPWRVRLQRSVLGYSALALGVGLLSGAGVLYGLGASEGDRAHDRYAAAADQASINGAWDRVQDARAKLYAGHALAGLGLLAVGAAVYALVTRPDTETARAPVRDASSATRVSLGAAPGPGGGVVTLGGRF